jgi:CelD/BcsL family acetyltransferase involved in cellulose biosynthesis
MATALRTRPIAAVKPSCALELLRAKTPDELDRLESPWRALDAVGGCPSSHFGWTAACLKAFADDAAMQVIAVARRGQLLAAAPLVRRRRHGVHRLFLAGVGQLHEPMDLVFSDEIALRRLTATMVRSGSPLWFERMPADSAALAALCRALCGRAIVVVRPRASYPYIELDESWAQPEQHLDVGRRGDLRRARLKAEQLGEVTIEIHAPGLHDLPGLLDTAFAVEASGRKGETLTALARDPQRAVFYRQYAQTACVEGTLRICLLRVGDRVAAMQVAVESDRGFWSLKAGRDERFAECSPDQLLVRETIRYAAEAALSSYAFWGQSESWARAWTTALRRCVSLRAYPFGPRGLSALAADAAAAGWRRWMKR